MHKKCRARVVTYIAVNWKLVLLCEFMDTKLSYGYDCLSSKILIGRKSRVKYLPARCMEPKVTRIVKYPGLQGNPDLRSFEPRVGGTGTKTERAGLVMQTTLHKQKQQQQQAFKNN
jgi:hypothetical protein